MMISSNTYIYIYIYTYVHIYIYTHMSMKKVGCLGSRKLISSTDKPASPSVMDSGLSVLFGPGFRFLKGVRVLGFRALGD